MKSRNRGGKRGRGRGRSRGRGRGRGRGGSRGGRGGGRNNSNNYNNYNNNNNNNNNKNNNNKRNLAVFEGVSEEFRIKRKEQLEKFRENDNGDEIIFGNTLTNHERRYVHALAGQLGLISKSYGKGESRYLTVRKTKRKDNKSLSVIQKLKFKASNMKTIDKFMKINDVGFTKCCTLFLFFPYS